MPEKKLGKNFGQRNFFPMDTFGQRLKEARGAMSQAVFASKLGIPQTTLSNYEKNKNEPSFAFIEKVCSEFHLNVDWLLFGRGPMHPDERLQQPQEERPNERIRELERQLAETKEELIRAYRLAATAMQPIAEDIQEIKRAISAPAHNKRIDEKEDQIKQVGK